MLGQRAEWVSSEDTEHWTHAGMTSRIQLLHISLSWGEGELRWCEQYSVTDSHIVSLFSIGSETFIKFRKLFLRSIIERLIRAMPEPAETSVGFVHRIQLNRLTPIQVAFNWFSALLANKWAGVQWLFTPRQFAISWIRFDCVIQQNTHSTQTIESQSSRSRLLIRLCTVCTSPVKVIQSRRQGLASLNWFNI